MGHPPYFSRVIHISCSFYIEKLRSKWGNMDDMGVKCMSNSQLTDVERSQWLAILDSASQRPGDEINAEWEWLLDQLGFPAEYFLAVLETIRQQRWRTAKNPRAYVKTVAKRIATKTGLLSESSDILKLVNAPTNGEKFSMEGQLDHLAHVSETSEAIRGKDGIWRRGEGWGDDYFSEDNPRAYVSYAEFLRLKMPKELRESVEPTEEYKAWIEEINAYTDEFHIHPKSRERINWDKLTDLAGFSVWDRLVLNCRLNGISRDQALAEQTEGKTRKALQAAWRKFDRNGLERIREVLKNNFAESVPELGVSDTR